MPRKGTRVVCRWPPSNAKLAKAVNAFAELQRAVGGDGKTALSRKLVRTAYNVLQELGHPDGTDGDISNAPPLGASSPPLRPAKDEGAIRVYNTGKDKGCLVGVAMHSQLAPEWKQNS
jgi:hypothetical protein